MDRSINEHVKADLARKIVLVTGPRQSGKTTLSKSLFDSFDYLNYDFLPHRLALKDLKWNRSVPLLVLDEIHKMRNWKSWLKGVYDVEGLNPAILVTGSSQLDTYKKMGDSLAGRFFQYRLHPLDCREIAVRHPVDQSLNRLMTVGGFPEPFLEGDRAFYQKWQRTHLDIILRQDLLDLTAVRDIASIETLIELLKTRVASTVSYASLSRDLERDATTIKRWLSLLENLYVIFKITPYAGTVARSIRKEPKFYFYDVAICNDTPGPQVENIVAAALLKEIHFQEDTGQGRLAVHFLRTKDGDEVDFIILKNKKPSLMIEVKLSDDRIHPGLKKWGGHFPGVPRLQLVRGLKKPYSTSDAIQVLDLETWLTKFSL